MKHLVLAAILLSSCSTVQAVAFAPCQPAMVNKQPWKTLLWPVSIVTLPFCFLGMLVGLAIEAEKSPS